MDKAGYDKEAAKWRACTACGLHKTRKQVVLGRGDYHCLVLFIGEAPGKSEDLLGLPFIGPAGKLLDQAIVLALKWAKMDGPLSIYITNACACRPTDSLLGENRPPTGDELWACYQRLEWECKSVADPQHVVFLGKVADQASRKLFPKALALQHPAYILRCGGLSSPVGIRFVRDLSNLFKEIKSAKSAEENKKPIKVLSRPGDHAVDARDVHEVSGGLQTLPGRLAKRVPAPRDGIRKPVPRTTPKLVRNASRDPRKSNI